MFILLKTRDSRVILLIKVSFLVLIQVVRKSVVGHALQAGRSPTILSFFSDVILPAALWPWRPLNP
jgi:hypothetical protein